VPRLAQSQVGFLGRSTRSVPRSARALPPPPDGPHKCAAAPGDVVSLGSGPPGRR
jgi:hypothetical protein